MLQQLITAFLPVLDLLGHNSPQELRYPSLSVNSTQLFSQLLDNFDRPGALPGLSIASPSTANPNYYYHWIRDGALNIDSVITAFDASEDPKLALLINNYINSSKILQTLPNRSRGVGEPKFYVEGQPFNGPWGRPQNDGPALRALVASKWIRNRSPQDIKEVYNSFIRTDLDYVAKNWALPSFDLWEELYGYHFFTSICQYGALKAGAIIAEIAGHEQDQTRFENVADKVVSFINSNFMPGRFAQKPHVVEHFPSNLGSRQGLDAATIIAILELQSLAGWTTEVDKKPLKFSLKHDAVRASIDALVEDFSHRYPINKGQPGGVGRYPEDVYDGVGTKGGGNPWFICTSAVAEALIHLGEQGRAVPLLQFILDHKGETLSEQMDKDTGFMRGAANLTWSYSAVIRAFGAYEGSL